MKVSLIIVPVLLIIFLSLISGGTIGCRTKTSDLQAGDTVIVFEDRRVLIPLGSDTSCTLIYTRSMDGISNYLHHCPVNPIRERQVGVKHLRLHTDLQGEVLAQAYFDGFKKGDVWSGYPFSQRIIVKEESRHGKYVIISWNDGVRFSLEWFTPNGDHLIAIHYVLDKVNFDELGGMAEMRRFAERVRLLPE